MAVSLVRVLVLGGLFMVGGISSALWGLNANDSLTTVSHTSGTDVSSATTSPPRHPVAFLDENEKDGEEQGDGEDSGTNRRRKPLPTYYGQIGITDSQRDELAVIQNEYEEKLEKLRDELKRLVAERDRKMEELLTPGQKLRLKELREAARARARKKMAGTTDDD